MRNRREEDRKREARLLTLITEAQTDLKLLRNKQHAEALANKERLQKLVGAAVMAGDDGLQSAAKAALSKYVKRPADREFLKLMNWL